MSQELRPAYERWAGGASKSGESSAPAPDGIGRRRGQLRLVAISAGDWSRAGVSGDDKARRSFAVGRFIDGSSNDARGVSAVQHRAESGAHF